MTLQVPLRHPIPISLEMSGPSSLAKIIFDDPIFVVGFDAGDWNVTNGLETRAVVSVQQLSPVEIQIQSISAGAPAGPKQVTLLAETIRLIDEHDRPVLPFTIVPNEELPELVSATFSTSTGDTVLTFDDEIVLMDTNKKPWGVRTGSVKQTVQTISQTGLMEITLTTNSDGPDTPGDFVSYDADPPVLENEFGQRILAVLEFPLTIIP